MADKDKAPERDKEMDELKAALQERDEQIEKMKSQLQAAREDASAKERNVRSHSLDAEKWEREKEVMVARMQETEDQLLREQYGRKFDDLEHNGFRVGDAEMRSERMDRVVRASKDGTNRQEREALAEAEFQFQRKSMQRDPVNVKIDQHGARVGGARNMDELKERTDRAVESAWARCDAEKKPQMYAQYLQEEMQKAS